MARGGRPGKKRTQYVRDSSGQFASTPGGKKATPSAVRKAAKAATLKGGTLAARTSLNKSRAKLKSIDKADQTLQTSLSKRAQKGALTRGSKKLTKAIKSNQTRLIGAKPNANTIKKKRPVSMAYVLKSVTRSMSSDDAQRITGNKPLAKRKIGVPSKLNAIKKNRGPIVNAKTKKLSPAQNISQIVKDATPKAAGAKKKGRVEGSAKPKAMTSAKSSKVVVETNKPFGWKIEEIGAGGKAVKTEYGGSWANPSNRASKKAPKIIKISRRSVPATTTKYGQAVPVTNANKPRRDRASNIMQQAIKNIIPFEKMKKLQIKASVAQNPYSGMSKMQRTRAANDLAKGEIQNRKADRSHRTGLKAYNIYTNVAGYTKDEGRVKWRRSGYRLTALGPGTIRGGARRNNKKPG
jgi:hypothetical protein